MSLNKESIDIHGSTYTITKKERIILERIGRDDSIEQTKKPTPPLIKTA
jgi:hypothetical protein